MAPTQEIDMTTQLSTKLAALAVALTLNSMMIGGIAYLFNGQLHQQVAVASTPGPTRATVEAVI
jgi:hypothetical protein